MRRTTGSGVALWAIAMVVSGAGPSTGCSRSAAEKTGATVGESLTPPARHSPRPRRLVTRVVATWDHDPTAYTQGLVWTDGDVLFESRGNYGQSAVTRYALGSLRAEHMARLDDNLFGEGLALVGDRLVQLTWKEGIALSYRARDLASLDRRPFAGEGWGLTSDGKQLISSDGSHVLSFRDPDTLAVQRRLEVTKDGAPQDRLNELEWAEGSIYANVYQTDQLVQIDPLSGAVTAVIDARELPTRIEEPRAEVLNGIAYRRSTGTFLLTGKYWDRIFEVRFEP